MIEKRFTVMKKFDGSYVICDKGEMLVADDCCDLLNELNKDFEDCEKLLDSKDDFIHKFKRDIEELRISIKLFEYDVLIKDKKIDEQQATITHLEKVNGKNFAKRRLLEKDNLILRNENEQLRMKLKGEDYIMVSEMLSNLRKTGICDGCKNKDKPVEWYLERGFSITGQICDRYEPEV